MKKLNSKILFLVTNLIYANSLGQSIMDYYVPSDSNYNKATFYTPSKTDDRKMTRVTFFTNNNDDTYHIKDVHLFEGQTVSVIIKKVRFTTSEVLMTQSASTSIIGNGKRQYYDPPQILLKMPSDGKVATWSNPREDGAKPTIFTSSWTILKVKGVSKKTIKVVEQPSDYTYKKVYYYVLGIGLMNTEFVENGKTTPFENFDGLSYE